MGSIDLNADVGESFGAWEMGEDAALLTVVSSANIACGFHAGDPARMRATARAAAAAGVAIGAHVAYRDLAGFGRRFLDADPAELADEILYQIGALDALARAEGARVVHVKPHGALYTAITHHEGHARAVVDAVQSHGGDLALVLLPGSRAAELARHADLTVIGEAFADRAYRGDGTLVPRREAGAVLHDPAQVAERMVRFARTGEIEAVDGTVLRPEARSICVHGDTPGALELARAVRGGLEQAGVRIESLR